MAPARQGALADGDGLFVLVCVCVREFVRACERAWRGLWGGRRGCWGVLGAGIVLGCCAA